MITLFDRVHVFDSGKHTGYLVYNLKTKHIEDYDILMTYTEVYNIIEKIDVSRHCVIFEDVSGKIEGTDKKAMCKSVGFVEGLCECLGITTYQQPPALRVGHKRHARQWFKRFYGECVTSIDDFVKYNNYMEHNVDAFAHCLTWLSIKYGNEGVKKYVQLKR